MTQGGLIVSFKGKSQSSLNRQDEVTDGEKSDEGIVAIKLTGKVAMVSELAHKVANADPYPKGMDDCAKP